MIPIQVPPLRSRKEHIPLLAEHFLVRFSREMNKPVAKISSEAMGRLSQYPWPGNVRELENVIERAIALETSSAILPERLPKEMSSATPALSADQPLAEGFSLDDHLRAIEADLVRRALEQSEGDRARACAEAVDRGRQRERSAGDRMARARGAREGREGAEARDRGCGAEHRDRKQQLPSRETIPPHSCVFGSRSARDVTRRGDNARQLR